MSFLILIGLATLFAWAYLAFAHGLFWLPLLPEGSAVRTQTPSIDIIVPARNEADVLPKTLPSLLEQDYQGDWQILLIDDHSTDGTADVARKIAADLDKAGRLKVIEAPDLREGWVGKVAAMNAGVQSSSAEMILFTDADIRHPAHSLSELAAHAEGGSLDLVSRMVMLNCESFAEKLLIPAFVFFFAMLYPFRRANNPASRIAAAAGGVILLRRKMLDKTGVLERIKSALIDDCSLARVVKDVGGRTELALSRDIQSLRTYPQIQNVWQMVARTAYTQLHYSPLILAGTIAGLAFLYAAPVLLFLFNSDPAVVISGFSALLLMSVLYLPMVKFYNLPSYWAFTLPAAAFVYAAATVDSARLWHKGNGGQWKGRARGFG